MTFSVLRALKRPFWHIVILLLLAGYTTAVILDLAANPDQYGWDFRTYYYAALAHAEGSNPYVMSNLNRLPDARVALNYVYPPLSLWIFRPFVLLEYRSAYTTWILAKSLVLVGLLLLWYRGFLREVRDSFFFLFCLFAYNSPLYTDFSSGNAALFEQVLIWIAFLCYIRERLIFFCVLIVCAAVFKLTPILFLVLLIFTETRGRMTYLFVSLAGFLIIQGISWLVNPSLFNSFLTNASHMDESGLTNPSTFSFLRDLYTLPLRWSGGTVPQSLVVVLTATIAVVLVIAVFQLCARVQKSSLPDKQLVIVFLSCLLYTLTLPRFKSYSFTLLLLPTYYLIKRIEGISMRRMLMIVALFGTFALPFWKDVFILIWTYSPLVLAAGVLWLYIEWLSTLEELQQEAA